MLTKGYTWDLLMSFGGTKKMNGAGLFLNN